MVTQTITSLMRGYYDKRRSLSSSARWPLPAIGSQSIRRRIRQQESTRREGGAGWTRYRIIVEGESSGPLRSHAIQKVRNFCCMSSDGSGAALSATDRLQRALRVWCRKKLHPINQIGKAF
jgi:hypothetical protein